MPHTNRKKKSSTTGADKKPTPKLMHTKRQQIEDESGWTHVFDTPRKTQLKAKEGLHMGDFERGGVAYVKRSMEELGKDLEYHTKTWKEGEACRVLETVLDGRAREVRDVVVLGLGSLQSARREGRRASFTQLVALRGILDALGTRGEQKLDCIFQEPQFTDLDKEFLTSLGYTVVKDPVAFGYITKRSLVYAIHCYAQIYKSVAEGPRPAVVIGTDVENFGKFNLNESTENIAKSLGDMVKDCEIIDFPQVRHDFSDTKIYWRKEKASEG